MSVKSLYAKLSRFSSRVQVTLRLPYITVLQQQSINQSVNQSTELLNVKWGGEYKGKCNIKERVREGGGETRDKGMRMTGKRIVCVREELLDRGFSKYTHSANFSLGCLAKLCQNLNKYYMNFSHVHTVNDITTTGM